MATAGASWWKIVESIVGADRVPAADGPRVSTACVDLASTFPAQALGAEDADAVAMFAVRLSPARALAW